MTYIYPPGVFPAPPPPSSRSRVPLSGFLDPFTAGDGECFDVIGRAPFGFVARSLRTGERVAFASAGIEAVEVERSPRLHRVAP